MSREVRRVPMEWQHPMEWAERWDRADHRTKMKLVPRALFPDYAGALADWQKEGVELASRTGWRWDFNREYHLTGYQGSQDSEPTIHQFDGGITVRDDDHLHELLTARHTEERPDPSDFMPDFSQMPDDEMGLCMYETTSEGTPMSPTFRTPEELARWLADTGASTFGYSTGTYEQWLSVCRGGWAPSAVYTPQTGVASGVEFMARTEGGAA